ncbi:ornithine aminomutase [Mesotoga sp. Brook.08.YT.4.2.5.1]|jgi:D-ornithine 4,5-aminomutase subunit alpha|uniref:ornithine aminomutase subunit alpha n=1 Tax=unclassified Mesotoga TaxID=1184398 RepID=UPI000AB2D037|nr:MULTISPECIES: ornithine aminomutase subunit alpha [unclassified Mesotoga]PNQ05523.1 ornithine aminomutase [Mesotoga sp. SC_NapDC3]PXF34609.1 ornithine aminomutase [Mesotoga sp. SC_NapDC]RIZ61207.1 ornithine aminomutase [Mesotoga sp. SC_NapDC2]MDD3460661.1 ornithine aminomutase subunit alpha [Mesotoga sp.]PNE19927.1 ornithine aminomutase [Mesotoga sp. Brook.08.YT.4.2.5.1]
MSIQRTDDFEKRSLHLQNLSDEDLDSRFWELADKIVEPLIELAEGNTSPSIERSVLLRMGLDSFQAGAIVAKAVEFGLLGKGAGNLVLSYAKKTSQPLEKAVEDLATGKGWEELVTFFRGGGESAAR